VLATVVVGVFSYRSYALATPDAARNLFKAMKPLLWCCAANVLGFALLTGIWLVLAYPIGLIIFARLSRAR
jgi:hypothetical protein